MIACTEIFDYLDARRTCERSPYGTKVLTQCLYPSADPVYVHVAKWGDHEFRVSDGGDAARSVMRQGKPMDAILTGLRVASDRFSLELEQEELVTRVPNGDWLPNAVTAVANGAAFAASMAVDHEHKSRQKSLREEIGERLSQTIPAQFLARSYEFRGRSGKLWQMDFALLLPDRPVFIKAVTPNYNSIASTYTTQSEALSEYNRRLSVFQRRPNDDDVALLRQVSEIVPLTALGPMTEAMFT